MSMHIEIPQPPRERNGVVDPRETSRWLQRVFDIFNNFPKIPWANVDKAGSKLSDLESRTHAMLQEVLGWISGSDTVQNRHISQANGKKWEDHVNTIGNPHQTQHGQLLSILGWSSGSDTAQDKHISQANGKKWEDHVDTIGNPHQTQHGQLLSILGWVSGSDTVQDRHISQANGKKWEDHVDTIGNPHQTQHSELLTPDYTGAHAAASIGSTPSGNLAATDVQAALNELDTEKAKLAGDTTQTFSAQTLTTSAIGGTAGQAWRLGTKKSATVALSTASYVEVEINGVVVKLGVVT